MKQWNNKFLYITVFFTGLSITAIELTISRIIAPYFGASILVWTNVIAIVLAGLALGYYIGGRIADKYPQSKYLFYIILSAGILFLIVPFLVKPLASVIILNPFTSQSSSLTILLASFFTIILLFMIPITFLAVTSPYIIKLISTDNKNIGNTSGKVFSIGTIGSIIGTFLPALLFIPFLGSKQTILFFACLLIFISAMGLIKNKLKIFTLIIFILPLSLANILPVKNSSGIILETESPYQYIQVIQKDSKKYLIFNEGAGIQTLFNENSVLSGSYYDYFTPLPYLLPKTKNLNILILGLAAGNMNNQYHHFFKNFQIDGVEIDRKVIEIAKEHFQLNEKNLNIYNQDARIFLKTTDKKYDLILMDVYKQHYLPEHMVTSEFFAEIKQKLNPNGIFAANIVSTSDKDKLFKSINNTIAKNFQKLYYLRIPNHYNYLVYASDKKIDFSSLRQIKNKQLTPVLQELKNIKKYTPDNNQVFTDDKSPVGMLTDLMILKKMQN